MTVPNFCKPEIMSTCTAGEKWKEHNRCYFAEKSTELNRCMFYMFDEYCDCPKAQQAEYNPVEMEQDLLAEIPLVETPKQTTQYRIIPDKNYPGNVKANFYVGAKKVCPIDHTSICEKALCSHWDFCKSKPEGIS